MVGSGTGGLRVAFVVFTLDESLVWGIFGRNLNREDEVQTTITEALAEIKTIGKRLETKRQFVRNYLWRQDGLKDPLDREGGSVEAIRRERQGILDLEQRLVRIRTAIQRSNNATSLTVEGVDRTVADWLTWRKEVAPNQQAFLKSLAGSVQQMRKEAAQKGMGVVASQALAVAATDIVVNVDERSLATEMETLESILGALDGRLSLANATTVVDI